MTYFLQLYCSYCDIVSCFNKNKKNRRKRIGCKTFIFKCEEKDKCNRVFKRKTFSTPDKALFNN